LSGTTFPEGSARTTGANRTLASPYEEVNSRTSRSYEPFRPVRIALSTATLRLDAAEAIVRGSIGQTGAVAATLDAGVVGDGVGVVALTLPVGVGEVAGDEMEEAFVGDGPGIGAPLQAAPTSERMQTSETRNAREDHIGLTP
jgi:hypothetical protein